MKAKARSKSLVVMFDITVTTFPSGSVWLTDAPESVIDHYFEDCTTEESDELEVTVRKSLRDRGFQIWKCNGAEGGNISDCFTERTGLLTREIAVSLNPFLR